MNSRRSFIKASAFTALATGLANDVLAQPINTAPVKDGLVFLFQGDSITDGNRGRNQADLNHVMGHGYACDIFSRVGADFPQHNFRFYNRGVGGNKIADLKNRWQADAMDLKPDVLSILAGVNDTNAYIRNMAAGDPLDQFEADYRSILSQSRQQNPDLIIILGLPFVYPGSRTNEHLNEWKTSVQSRQAIVKKLSAEFNTVVVDFPAVLDKAIRSTSVDYWVWDGVHPTMPAHELMAREWIKQASKPLPFLKAYKSK